MINSTYYLYQSFESIGHLQVDSFKDTLVETPNCYRDIVFDVQSDRNEPFLTKTSQPLYVMLNPLQRIQERELKNLSSASWEGVQVPFQPESTTKTASSKIIAVSANNVCLKKRCDNRMKNT